ncbi:MAG: hypothetical protein ACLQU3_22005 [Limisphaerales bacterium]|jgi:hypothetical protein
MKFSGTQAQLFQAIQDGGQRFQCIGRMGFPNVAALAAGAAGLVTVGAGAALSKKVADQKQKREVKKLVKREVQKAVKARQPGGISFNLFS